MTNWKKAIVIGSLTAGAVLALKGKRPAAVLVSTAGLAVLAAEYPDKFETVWEQGPEYLTRGLKIFSVLSRLAEQLADEAAQRGLVAAWEEARAGYSRY